jgi:hypothetical protein
MSSLFSPCDWVGSERFCRPYFRLAIGSALVVYVVPVFALQQHPDRERRSSILLPWTHVLLCVCDVLVDNTSIVDLNSTDKMSCLDMLVVPRSASSTGIATQIGLRCCLAAQMGPR